MDLNKWKSLSEAEREKVRGNWDTLNGEGYDLAKQAATEFKNHCRWNYEKFNVLNRFTELIICVYLENEDYQDADKSSVDTYLGFKVHYDKLSNYFEQ
jgi:hypothetical protein